MTLPRRNSWQLGEMFSRSPITVQRDLRFMKAHPFFDVDGLRVLGGGYGQSLTCSPEVYELFLKYRRFFREGQEWERLAPLSDMIKKRGDL